MPDHAKSIASLHHFEVIEPAFFTRRVDGYFRDRVKNTWQGGHIMKGRQPESNALLLGSNDYLNLSGHFSILESQVRALREGDGRPVRSDVFRNGDDLLREFEREAASWIGAEDTVACQSGWNANTGLIQSIANSNTPVYLDMFAHTSLWEGALCAGATPRPFKHNQVRSLERLISKHGPGVVAVDAVYSTSGSLCDLEAIISVAEAGGCVIVVDESHSLGVIGERGEGLTFDLGLTDRVHFRTSSLSKAFALRGGPIAGSRRNLDFFRYESRPAIFSSGLLHHEAAGFLSTMKMIQEGKSVV